MPYTDEQIKKYALALGAQGAPEREIEAFVAAAKAERGGAGAPVPGGTQTVQTNRGPITIRSDQELTPNQAERLRYGNLAGNDAGAAPKRGQGMGAFGSSIGYFPTPGQLGKIGGAAVDIGLEGGGAAAGQMIGAMGGPLAPATVPIGGALGAGIGNAMGQMRRGDKFSVGQMLGASLAGAIPGGSLAKASLGTVAKEGAKQAVGNVAAKAVQTGVDEGRMPTMKEGAMAGGAAVVGTGIARGLDKGLNAVTSAEALKRSQDALRRETITLGKELGYVLPPSVLRPNLGTDVLNSVAGKAATAQEAIRRNQPITNKAVREELGLQPGDAISPGALNAARFGPNATYAKASAISPSSKVMLDDFKQAQADANQLFTTYREQFPKKPEILAAAKQRQLDADAAMLQLEGEAVKVGKPELIDELKAARVKLAKIGLAERALNKGDGNIDASVIGSAYDHGEKLTGNFEKIGRFQNAFASAVREASKTPPSGVNQLMPILAGGAATYGGMRHGVQGAALGASVLMAPRVAREVALSQFLQQRLNPSYGITRQDAPALLARQMTQTAGRNAFIDYGAQQSRVPPPMARQQAPQAQPQQQAAPQEPPPPPPVIGAEVVPSRATPSVLAARFVEGRLYRDKDGNLKRFVGGEFIDP